MLARMRGINTVVTVALLLVVGIAAAFLLFSGYLGFLKPSTTLFATAQKISNTYINSGTSNYQVAVVGIKITNKSDKQLTIDKIIASIIYADGSTGTAVITYDPTNGWSVSSAPTGLTVTVNGQATINPGGSTSIMLTLKQDISQGPQIRQVSFQIEAKDPAGNTVTVNTPAVSLT